MSVARSVASSVSRSVAGNVGAGLLQYDFNGTNGWIEVPAAATGSAGTLALDVTLDDISASLRGLADIGGAGTSGLILFGSISSSVRLQYGTGASTAQITFAGATGTPYRMVMTWSGSNVAFYVNGTTIGSSASANTSSVNVQKLFLGSQGAGAFRFFDGQLRNVEAYSVAKDASWASDYASGTHETASRTLYFDCNDNNPTTALDKSGSGNNGTKNNITSIPR